MAAGVGAGVGVALLGRRLGLLEWFGAPAGDGGIHRSGPVVASRRARNVETARLASSIGARAAVTSARKVFAGAERRRILDERLSMRTAEQVVESLGGMKGALMKVGQMASYLDEGLPEPVRDALASLQAGAPPMSGELAAECIERDLGARPDELFLEWDPVPLAAASIGQVHRALCVDPADGLEKAVAVKVQYPGVDEAITADLANADLFANVLRMLFRGLDPEPLVEEIRERVVEELDYLREADNQRLFAAYYQGHPFIHVPPVIDAFCGRRVLTTELATGARFDELLTWPQEEKDLAAEAIYRFVFRSLYRFQAFNGDPHPGNYLFERGGRVTFLDFGLVKRFTNDELAVFEQMIDAAVLHPDPARFRQVVEDVGLLRRGASVTTEETSQLLRGLLRHRAGPSAQHHHAGLRQRPGAPGVRHRLADRPARHPPPVLRGHPAHQPGPVLDPGPPLRHPPVALDRRGAVAHDVGPTLDTHGRGRGGVAALPLSGGGGGGGWLRSVPSEEPAPHLRCPGSSESAGTPFLVSPTPQRSWGTASGVSPPERGWVRDAGRAQQRCRRAAAWCRRLRW